MAAEKIAQNAVKKKSNESQKSFKLNIITEKKRRKTMNKKLQKKIEKKLDKLTDFLNQITKAQVINADDPNTWDVDTLYDLVEQFKKALKLLEDQKTSHRNEFGETITSWEPGLCSLVDDYHEDEEEEEDYD